MNKLHILVVGKIERGVIDWHVTPPASIEDAYAVPDGEIQRLIDEAHDTAEYEEDMEDRAFWARGEW